MQGLDAQVAAQRQAVIASLSHIEGAIIGQGVKADTHENLHASLTATGSIRAYVRNEVTGDITSTDGSIYVNAQTIRGNRISAPNGFVGLDVFGHLGVSPAPPCPPPPGGAAVQVEGGRGITASVLGTIDGSFVSALGGVLLLADGDVSGTVSAGDDRVGIGLVSWGSVAASLTAANGSVIVAFAFGDEHPARYFLVESDGRGRESFSDEPLPIWWIVGRKKNIYIKKRQKRGKTLDFTAYRGKVANWHL